MEQQYLSPKSSSLLKEEHFPNHRKKLHLSLTLCHWHSSQLYKQKKSRSLESQTCYQNPTNFAHCIRWARRNNCSILLNVAVGRTEFVADVLMINTFQIFDGKYTEVCETCNGKYNKESKCCKKYCKYLHF